MSERLFVRDQEPRTQELSAELQATYEQKQPTKPYALGCGDDRWLTPESRQWLRQQNPELGEFTEQIRYFGGIAGLTHVVAVAAIEQGRSEDIDALGETFPELMSAVRERLAERDPHMIPQLHSAVKNEGDSAHFQPDHDGPVGCAYGAGLGAVSRIALSDDHEQLSQQEVPDLFGDVTPPSNIELAKDLFVKRYYPNPAISGISREEFGAVGAPIQVLAGEHAAAKDTLVVINFHPDKVSNQAKAQATTTPFYNNDVTQVAETILRTFPEFDFDPETLLRIMDDDIRATRAALAGKDGAAALQVRRYGTPNEAIDYLAAVKAGIA